MLGLGGRARERESATRYNEPRATRHASGRPAADTKRDAVTDATPTRTRHETTNTEGGDNSDTMTRPSLPRLRTRQGPRREHDAENISQNRLSRRDNPNRPAYIRRNDEYANNNSRLGQSSAVDRSHRSGIGPRIVK